MTRASAVDVFSHPDFDHHEHVAYVHDPAARLQAIIAIHDSRNSFAAGGIRMQPYRDTWSALTDVLRLSRAMTYKLALAGLRSGGAKSVILGDPGKDKTPTLLGAFGRAVERLGGYYRCGGDVGITAADMEIIRQNTQFTPPAEVGDLGLITAEGVYHAVRAAVNRVHNSDSLTGMHVAIQGVGQVGARLADMLARDGCRLTVADTDNDRLQQVVKKTGASVQPIEKILMTNCDVLCPCALGGVLNADSIPKLQTRLICGAANNQLLTAENGHDLKAKNIIYVPDFIANAGGVIGGLRIDCGYTPEQSAQRVAGIYDSVLRILDLAQERDIATHQAAEDLARKIMAAD